MSKDKNRDSEARRNNREIHRSVLVNDGGQMMNFGPGQEDDLEALLTPSQVERLTKTGAISGDWRAGVQEPEAKGEVIKGKREKWEKSQTRRQAIERGRQLRAKAKAGRVAQAEPHPKAQKADDKGK